MHAHLYISSVAPSFRSDFAPNMAPGLATVLLPCATYATYEHDYLDMIQGITELKQELLYSIVKTPLHTNVPSATPPPTHDRGPSFGFAMRSITPSVGIRSKSPSRSPSPDYSGLASAVAARIPPKFVKTASLLHSEAGVYMALQEGDRARVHSRHETMQSVLWILRDNKTIAVLGDIVDMLAASASSDIRRLYLHMATIVAFHHYIRVVVHKTGNYKAKKTIVLLEEYKNVLLQGFLNTPLTEDQYSALRRYTPQ